MFLPRFSIRWVLAATACCAVGSFVVGRGIAGAAWALSLSAALAVAVGVFGFYALAFAVAYWLGRVSKTLSPPAKRHTPFVDEGEGEFPPQRIPQGPAGEPR